MVNITFFSQIISKLDGSKFKKLVNEKQIDKHNKGYTSWTHLVSMLFCQFAKSQSVRDISNALRSATRNLPTYVNITDGKTADNKGAYEILLLKALKAQSKYAWYLSNLVAFIRLNLFKKLTCKCGLIIPSRSSQSHHQN